MNDENTHGNETQAENQTNESGWEFFISQEERHSQLNAETPTENGNRKDKKQKPWIIRIFAEPNATDWFIFFFTAVIAGASILQWNAISGQLQEMKGAGKQTDELICLYRQQVKTAEDNVRVIQKQMQLDQRAWVMPPPGKPQNPHIVIGEGVSTSLVVQNTGKTPAKHVEVVASLDKVMFEGTAPLFSGAAIKLTEGTLFHGERSDPLRVDWKRFDKPGKLGPTDEIATRLIVTPSDYSELMGHRAFFILHGGITYRDVFDIKHWTQFCYSMIYSDPPRIAKNLKDCVDYNDVDNN